ncbi:MAG: endonuclease MutS2, partial [Chloroflexi bacterium]
GDTVWVPTLQTTGQVTALEDGEAEVQVGRMRVRVRADALQWRPPEPAPEVEESPRLARTPAPSPGVELDLRGLTVDEALPRLDRYLDAAALAGLPWGRIIHGKGTGRLRRAVRRMLADHPLVQRYEPGRENEGGDGVTIVHLASS